MEKEYEIPLRNSTEEQAVAGIVGNICESARLFTHENEISKQEADNKTRYELLRGVWRLYSHTRDQSSVIEAYDAVSREMFESKTTTSRVFFTFERKQNGVSVVKISDEAMHTDMKTTEKPIKIERPNSKLQMLCEKQKEIRRYIGGIFEYEDPEMCIGFCMNRVPDDFSEDYNRGGIIIQVNRTTPWGIDELSSKPK